MAKHTRGHPLFSPGDTKTAWRIALSYCIFLFACLSLIMALYFTSTDNARRNYWDQQAAELDSAIDTMTRDLSIMDNYTRQLFLESSFVRLANMQDVSDNSFYYTAYEVKQALSDRMYGLMNLPIREEHIYLRNTGYVISHSQFTESEQYYRAYRHFVTERYDEWIDLLNHCDVKGTLYNIEPYTGQADTIALVQNMDKLSNRGMPATLWFELDVPSIKDLLLPQDALGSVILIDNAEGERLLAMVRGPMNTILRCAMPGYDESTEASTPPNSKKLVLEMENAAWDADGMAWAGPMRLIRRTGENGWVYTLALPGSMCTDVLGDYDMTFMLIFVLALLLGLVMVAYLVRRSMRPLHQLNTQLQKAEGDKAELQKEIDAQRPMLCMSYVRTLVSGHVSSNEEFAYMTRFLGIEGDNVYFVLFCNAHHQDSSIVWDDAQEHQLLVDSFNRYLDNGHPLYLYATLGRDYVVLVTYDKSTEDPLMDLQRRVVAMHDDLSDNHALWFYAGVGNGYAQPKQIWESYEQARAAARYTGKSHIFLPYSFVRKDTDSWYYPVELSAKLQHFITTSNKQQVGETFALIHHENMDARTLSAPLLNFLLSDLKNTLLKVRFQVKPPETEEGRALLTQLDRSLAEPLRFPQLERNALLLCDFFTSSAEPSDPIPEVERYLQENFSDPSLCLSKLSEMFNISESYLSHMFKDRTGQNFSTYLEALRMNEAARRLQNRDCNLTNLYMDLGYTNPTSFRRAFKKHFGMTPSEMRQQA